MLRAYQEILNRIKSRQEEMISLLIEWTHINSHSDNLPGLAKMLEALDAKFSSLGETKRVPLSPRKIISSQGEEILAPLGNCLLLRKRPQASIQVFLGGHMDTVYSALSSFQTAIQVNHTTLKGPGVADMKGGLVVLLQSLQALEESPFAEEIGWTLLLNSDEELGSPGSRVLYKQYSKGCHLGLIYEPSLPDGTFVSSRKGSANFTVVARGRSAHAGRDFYSGRNAIRALAHFILKTEKVMNQDKGVTLNIGHVEGGKAANIIPNLAICKINLRAPENREFEEAKQILEQLIQESNTMEGISLTLYEDTTTPPKPFDQPQQNLFREVTKCCDLLGFKMESKPSGGTCDGSRLYFEGVPNIDTMGVVGDFIHTHEEYVHLPSLCERTQLSALFLMMLANHEIEPIKKEKNSDE
jgi:glutamate carboxypeptidase